MSDPQSPNARTTQPNVSHQLIAKSLVSLVGGFIFCLWEGQLQRPYAMFWHLGTSLESSIVSGVESADRYIEQLVVEADRLLIDSLIETIRRM